MGITVIPLQAPQKRKPIKKNLKHTASSVAIIDTASQEIGFHPLRRGYLYVAGCDGAKDLATELPSPTPLTVYKLGLTTCGYLDRRLEALGRDRYGSVYLKGNELVCEQGFETWCLQEIIASPRQSPLVEVGARHLAFDLPDGMSLEEFDDELRRAFHDLALTSVIQRLKPKSEIAERFDRFTAYSMGSGSRLSRATEFFCLKTRVEGDQIVQRVAELLTRLNARARNQDNLGAHHASVIVSDKNAECMADKIICVSALPVSTLSEETSAVSTEVADSNTEADIPGSLLTGLWRKLRG